jgi:hypothetical protein
MSIYNVIELFKHPKAGKENGPVFHHIIDEVNQCTACIEIPSIVFVRYVVSEDSRNKESAGQKNRFPGIPVAGFLPLMIPCGFDILETGTCSYVPTGRHEFTYARTSDAVVINGRSTPLVLGGFMPGVGVIVYDAPKANAYDSLGAIPMIPVEVQPVVVGSLDISNGQKTKYTEGLSYSRPSKEPVAKRRKRL